MSSFTNLPRGHKSNRQEASTNAQWMEDRDIAAMEYQPGAILLGSHNNRLIGIQDDRHIMTVAGSRAGKSSSCLKPNLKLWPSSVLCIDPKGELATETAKHRSEMGQDVIILDPFEEVKGEARQWCVGYDPLSELTTGKPEDLVDDAAMIAEALIIESGSEKSEHWTLAARNVIRGLILYLVQLERETGNKALLGTVRYLITLPYEGDASVLFTLETALERMRDMDEGSGIGGAIAAVGSSLIDKPPNERASILSTAIEQTAFLDSPPMKAHLETPGLDTLRRLKRKPTTIYLVLPASRMATHNRWLRVILTLALSAMEREPMNLQHPVLFVLEEFPSLGYLRQIESAAGLMAGYGVKLWTVLQDLTQIQAHYKKSWETFIGNAGFVQAFGNTDATTTNYISKMLGTRLMKEVRDNQVTASSLASGASINTANTNIIHLLEPFEVALYGGRDSGKQFIMIAGNRPAYLDRLSHDDVEKL